MTPQAEQSAALRFLERYALELAAVCVLVATFILSNLLAYAVGLHVDSGAPAAECDP